MNKHYPDPYTEATTHTARNAVRLVALGAWTRQRYERRRRGNYEDSQSRESDEAGAYDPERLSYASFAEAAQTWRAAMPSAATDSTAADILNRCEKRLRTLHPYAMARYDRLRGDGMRPAEAMTEVAPLFACRPYARAGESGPSPPALEPTAATRTVSDLVAEDFPRDIETAMRASAHERPLSPQPPSPPQSPRRRVK